MVDVLGGFFSDHIDHVVYGDNAQEATISVGDRDREKIVSGDHLRDFFLVCFGGDRDGVLRGQVGDGG